MRKSKDYTTEIIKPDGAALERAAAVLKDGGVVAFPTETVYGLGGSAFSESAVKKIFAAKGRPADNPLIVHIARAEDVYKVAEDIPADVIGLMERLGPAPLTYVVKKSGRIPGAVTAGLNTVAVRIPAHPAALALIDACGLPLAAPSANSSGRPSPTSASHVYSDLKGRIPLILDGGDCGVGVESTVVDFTGSVPLILRPGGFSKEQLEDFLGREAGLYKKPGDGPARSPGLKYRHYAPRCGIEIVPYSHNVAEFLKKAYDNRVQKGEKTVIICQDIYGKELGNRGYISLGNSDADAARSFFRILRENEDGYGVLICHLLEGGGVGRAFNDRLLRAAAVSLKT